jgi:hypothetical protein
MIGLFAIILHYGTIIRYYCTYYHHHDCTYYCTYYGNGFLIYAIIAPIIRYYCSLVFLLFSIMAGCLPLDIWNPVPLDRIRQNGTYWYVPVRTSATRYKTVREFDGSTYRYVPVRTGTYFQQDKLLSDSPRKSQER